MKLKNKFLVAGVSLFMLASLFRPGKAVTPTEKALLGNAVSIILIHNHPSGDCTPSRPDIEVTKRLVEAGKIVGVEVLDHIIIGQSYTSLKEKGYL